MKRRHFLALSVSALSSCGKSVPPKASKILVPSDRVIPPPSCFGGSCYYNIPLMDDLSAGFTRGKPFKYDIYPYTAILCFKGPAFDLRIWCWADAEVATDSFAKGRENVKEEFGALAAVGGFKKQGDVNYFTYLIGGKVAVCSMVVGNIHFSILDLYQEIGGKGVLDHSMAYAKFLTNGSK